MNYKKIIPILTLLFLFGLQKVPAQDSHKFNPNRTYSVGVANPWWHGGTYLISIKPDKNTKRIYPNNYLKTEIGLTGTNPNFVYLQGTQSLQIHTSLNPSLFKDYRYRIILNDTTEIVHWKVPSANAPTFKSRYIFNPSNRKVMKIDTTYYSTMLSSLECKGKKVTIQMYNIHQPNNVYTIYIYNKPIPQPKIIWIASIKSLKREKGMTYRSITFPIGLKEGDTNHSIGIDSIYKLKVAIKENDAQMIYHIYVKNLSIKNSKSYQIPVQWNTETKLASIWKNGQAYQTSNQITTDYVTIPKYIFNKPGKYQITIVPELSGNGLKDLFKDKAAAATFTVLPPTQKSYTFSQIAPFAGGIALLLGIGFWQYKTHQNKKLSSETRQKEMTKTQLSAIRSQLNPHFMYNALAGIQNLMNKNETEKANEYLGKFSRLTRNVLEESASNLISIANEEMLLDDYLQMEQLRFGFQYAIDIDKNINKENTEIPAMLLQPFSENAVKHGIAGLKSKGNIHIRFHKNEETLSVQIKDNGTGFDTGKKQDGFGLKLSQKRIALLNEIYKEAYITLKIQSGKNGTTVSINLRNWI